MSLLHCAHAVSHIYYFQVSVETVALEARSLRSLRAMTKNQKSYLYSLLYRAFSFDIITFNNTKKRITLVYKKIIAFMVI